MQVTNTTYITAGDGNTYRVSVTYDQDANIPENADLAVRELGDDEKEDYVNQSAETLGTDAEDFAFARAFDISLLDPETGDELQPASGVKVSISLLDTDVSAADELSLLHFGKEVETVSYTLNDGAVEFETDGFSVYVITGENAVPRRTYEFRIWKDDAWSPYMFTSDSGVETSSQTVRNGQKPAVPQPEKDATGKVFAGWYEFKENSTTEFEDEPYDFDTPVTQDEVVSLHAVFSDYLYVIFHDQYNDEIHDFPIAGSRRGEPNNEGKATVMIGDMSTTYSGGSDMAFYGWSYTPITVPGNEKDDNGETVAKVDSESIEITANTHLYPIYKSVKWLSFWSGPTGSGATYFPARSYFDGIGPDTLADYVPTRSGYTFLGWYAGTIDPVTGEVTYGANPITYADGTLINSASDAGMAVYDNALHLTLDSTLFAQWAVTANANYTVNIYKDDDENPVKTYLETGSVGSSINLDKYRFESIPGYLYNRYDGSLTVAADAVLKVYYSSYTPSPFSTLTFRDSAKEDSDTPLITASNVATGELLSTHAPNENPVRNGYSFSGWFLDKSCTKQVDIATATMPDHDLTLYAGWEVEWYLVQIDPNYGSFNGTGSTWTWKTIESDLIQEYTQVTRDYVESSSGQYYYYKWFTLTVGEDVAAGSRDGVSIANLAQAPSWYNPNH